MGRKPKNSNQGTSQTNQTDQSNQVIQKDLPKLPYGMGSYNYRGDKIRYRKKCKYKDEEKYLEVVGDTVQEVNHLMREKELDWQNSIDTRTTVSGVKQLRDVMEEWLKLYKKDELKDRSYDRIESIFNTHIKNTDLGRMTEDRITSDIIQKHLRDLRSVKDNSPLSYSSVKKVYELLNQFFKYRYARDPHGNPMLTVPKLKKEKIEQKRGKDITIKEEMTILTDDEMKALTKVAYRPYEVGKGGYVRGLGICFMMWTFLRSGEARALRWNDIDFKDNILNIERQISTIKNRDEDYRKKYINVIDATKYDSARKFKIPKIAMDIAIEYKKRIKPESDDEYFLTNSHYTPISETAIRDVLGRMLVAAGIKKHLRIHDLRHTGISYMLRHEVPVEVVSRMAGHKEIETTYRVYYQILEKQKFDAIDTLDEKTYEDLNDIKRLDETE